MKEQQIDDDDMRMAIEKQKERMITSLRIIDNKTGKRVLDTKPDKRLGVSRSPCFMNLLRKTVCAVLANHGFIIREILVSNGAQIALILTLPEAIIKKEAEILKINKEVEFGMADLMSLEPVDVKGRPLRINVYLQNDFLWNSTYKTAEVGDEVKTLRKRILKLQNNEANMKKLIRIAGGIWTDPISESQDLVYEPCIVELDVWRQYERYLQELATHMKSIDHLARKVRYITNSYYGNSRFVTRGNYSRKFLDEVEVCRFVSRLSSRAFKLCLKNQDKLKSLWDLMDTKPLKYMFPYHMVNSHMRPNTKKFYEMIYSDYYCIYPHNKHEFNLLSNNDSAKIEEEDMKKYMQSSANREENDEDIKPEIHYYSFSKAERLKVSYTMVKDYYAD